MDGISDPRNTFTPSKNAVRQVHVNKDTILQLRDHRILETTTNIQLPYSHRYNLSDPLIVDVSSRWIDPAQCQAPGPASGK